MSRIYLDSAASTKIDSEVLKEMIPYYNEYYSIPSSQFSHSFGIEVSDAISASRAKIRELLGAKKDEEIIFTSSGTESNNLAIKGFAYANSKKGKHLVTSQIEHLSVLESFRRLEKEGFEVTYISVDSDGRIDLDLLKQTIREDTILVSVQLGNHETGTVQDIDEISRIVSHSNAALHVDAAISYPYFRFPLSEKRIDLMTLSPHKFYGPKGIGILYVRDGIRLSKLMDGGFNEFNLRAGGENTPGIIGAKKALEVFSNADVEKLLSLRKLLRERIENEVPEVEVNGSKINFLPHIINYTFKYVEGESVALRLDFEGIAVTTGSACYSRNLQASYILLAMGKTHEQSHGSIRFSFSKYNTEEEINFTVDRIKEIIKDLRDLSPLGKE